MSSISRRARSSRSRSLPAWLASSAPLRILEKSAPRNAWIASPSACSPMGAAAWSSWALIASSSACCSASQARPESSHGEAAARPVRGGRDEACLGELLQDWIDRARARAVGPLEARLQAPDDVVAVPRLLGDQAEDDEAQRARIEHPPPAPAGERAAEVAAEKPAKSGVRPAVRAGGGVARRAGRRGRAHGRESVSGDCGAQG